MLAHFGLHGERENEFSSNKTEQIFFDFPKFSKIATFSCSVLLWCFFFFLPFDHLFLSVVLRGCAELKIVGEHLYFLLWLCFLVWVWFSFFFPSLIKIASKSLVAVPEGLPVLLTRVRNIGSLCSHETWGSRGVLTAQLTPQADWDGRFELEGSGCQCHI